MDKLKYVKVCRTQSAQCSCHGTELLSVASKKYYECTHDSEDKIKVLRKMATTPEISIDDLDSNEHDKFVPLSLTLDWRNKRMQSTLKKSQMRMI